jgi:predicted component of type VI protein secretion system
MAFIRKVKTASGATAVQIIHKNHSQVVRIEHIGSAHNAASLQLLLAVAKRQLLGNQRSLLLDDVVSQPTIRIRQSVSNVLFDSLHKLYKQLDFDQLDDQTFALLCIARLVEPTSKLDSLRVLRELGINIGSNTSIHRCLQRIIANNYRDKLAKLCFAHASQGDGITLVLYDVTTLYFEVQKEDEYRIPGMSKERRLEPQVVVGLLVDQNGFPLELHSFEGNKAETKTIVPVVEAFKQRHGLAGITVVADAGMLSAKNLEDLTEAGYTYIVGSRMNKIPYDIAEFQKTNQKLTDNQVITSETAVTGQRIIYQYRQKRAALDLRNIEKQIEKAERIVSGRTAAKKAKFLTTKTKGKRLNQVLIDKAKALAGVKGYVTNLSKIEASNEQVIAYYHQLWHVEQSFRMSKSDLRARPIFHQKKEAIEAHLTVVMAALAIGRTIEQKTGLSIKKFVKTLRPIRSGIVVIDGKEYKAEAEIPMEVMPLLRKLGY